MGYVEYIFFLGYVGWLNSSRREKGEEYMMEYARLDPLKYVFESRQFCPG